MTSTLLAQRANYRMDTNPEFLQLAMIHDYLSKQSYRKISCTVLPPDFANKPGGVQTPFQ